MVVPPNHPWINRVFHYFYHSILGVFPLFLETFPVRNAGRFAGKNWDLQRGVVSLEIWKGLHLRWEKNPENLTAGEYPKMMGPKGKGNALKTWQFFGIYARFLGHTFYFGWRHNCLQRHQWTSWKARGRLPHFVWNVTYRYLHWPEM